MAPDPAQSAAQQVAAWLRVMPGRALLELASRVGYAARGAVYLSMGTIALLAALDLTPKAAGASGAILAWAGWPAGLILMVLVGWGLLAFALWRALQAIFDADGRGSSLHALSVRAGQAISGLVHGAIGLTALELADGLEDLDEEGAARGVAEQVLSVPGGDWALLVAGGFILSVGIGNVIQALAYDFTKRLEGPHGARRWAAMLARVGYLGRAVAFAPLGFFMTRAGLQTRASEVRSLGGALQALEDQPMGSFVLALTALGLIAFGLFALVEARYRRISLPRLVS